MWGRTGQGNDSWCSRSYNQLSRNPFVVVEGDQIRRFVSVKWPRWHADGALGCRDRRDTGGSTVDSDDAGSPSGAPERPAHMHDAEITQARQDIHGARVIPARVIPAGSSGGERLPRVR
jgi:hypothetical protein